MTGGKYLALACLIQVPSVFAAADTYRLNGTTFRLEARLANGQIAVRLNSPALGMRVSDGPLVYSARVAGSSRTDGIERPTISFVGGALVIRGRLAGLDLKHRFRLLKTGDLEERIFLTNTSRKQIHLDDLEIGLTRPVADAAGRTLPEVAGDRFAAVPLLHRATDPRGLFNDYSVADLVAGQGWEPEINGVQGYRQVPSAKRLSEGWAWTHGTHTLGFFRFCQTHMQFAALVPERDRSGWRLRFGGACTFSGEPAALSRVRPGDRVDLGVSRYHVAAGGYEACAYAFRDFLDAQRCRFPATYNPPIHWEQLYDMEGAWDDRPHRYTLEALEKEARKGEAYRCEALYLDPGWDSAFATFWWGEWLGSEPRFARELRTHDHLALSLHTPLATWMSVPFIMGPPGVDTWPAGARRKPPSADAAGLKVPALQNGRRNLALNPKARAAASSVYANGANPFHQTSHLNDGWYGNTASWIAGDLPSWVEIDLGEVFWIGEVRLGNDRTGQYKDRAATHLRILASSERADDSRSPAWKVVFEDRNCSLAGTQSFPIAATAARWVRVEILSSRDGLPRLDEVEVYDAEPSTETATYPDTARRGPAPPAAAGPTICLGSRQYLDEAERRLLANCAAGAAFLMFDGNWWNGGCDDPTHGHPVPYRWEDHIRANVELVRRVHAHYPHVLIEMHDMLAGGSPVRITPVYYKYGLPGSYDDNWGFELMWDPMADIREGRASCLYYYNLGCNVPLYLHIDLRKDNLNCLVLWWYASTCRHLGIGGTHKDPAVVTAQQQAMNVYRRLERFYKRGDFFGSGPEIHAHVLPSERACVVNLFNLSDRERVVEGTLDLSRRGLDARAAYLSTESWATVARGKVHVRLQMAPWSTAVAEIAARNANR